MADPEQPLQTSSADAEETPTVEDISDVAQTDQPATANASEILVVEDVTDTDQTDQPDAILSDNENDGAYMPDDDESSQNPDEQPIVEPAPSFEDFLTEQLACLKLICHRLNAFAPGEYTMDIRNLTTATEDTNEALVQIILSISEIVRMKARNMGITESPFESPTGSERSFDSEPPSPRRAPPPIPEHTAQGQPAPAQVRGNPFGQHYSPSRFIDILNLILVAVFLTLIFLALFNELAPYFISAPTNNHGSSMFPVLKFRALKKWNTWAPYANETQMQQARKFVSKNLAKFLSQGRWGW
jgi:hypothetical protein